MQEIQPGDTIASLAEQCTCFEEDLFDVNVEGIPESAYGVSEEASEGLAGNTADSDLGSPNADAIWPKTGWKLPVGDPGAPEDHVGGTRCRCCVCALEPGWIRVFRKSRDIECIGRHGALWPSLKTRAICFDCLHWRMRIMESVIWAYICAVLPLPSM
eukprot:1302963-Rhodomonas_salina.1